MEFKKITYKVLTLSDSEKNLLENAAIFLSNLYEKDEYNQIANQVTEKTVGGAIYDFEDMSIALHELANNEYVIKGIE